MQRPGRVGCARGPGLKFRRWSAFYPKLGYCHLLPLPSVRRLPVDMTPWNAQVNNFLVYTYLVPFPSILYHLPTFPPFLPNSGLYYINPVNTFDIVGTVYHLVICRVIHKSVKHLKNSQQIDYATDHGNSYVDREKLSKFFFKEKPAHIVALICR